VSIDLSLLGDKLRRYREQFALRAEDVAAATGIDAESIRAFESGLSAPSGDQILIFADFFKCDYKFFISNDKLAPIDQTEALFRRHGDAFSPKDRWALQEVLFLAECESFLQQVMGKALVQFSFEKQGNYFKAHGESAAIKLRKELGYKSTEIPLDVFADFRKLGIHIFRRKLENSNISGLYVKHPAAGPTVLINYGEDVYRQRFTAAHEAGHSLLDAEEDFVVSLERSKELNEVRANAFAGHFLLPRSVFADLVDARISDDEFVKWSNKLKVNPESLSIALLDAKKISPEGQQHYRELKIPRPEKVDVELPQTLSPGTRERKSQLLERGLSDYYVKLCIDAYDNDVVSSGRLVEMLLCSNEMEAAEILTLYGHKFAYAS
jgi:Zn-dependent peptidase ImmA (M78 family)/transcriptional regulator with XRE-family HTH domain